VQDPRITIVTASVDRIRLAGIPSIDVNQHLSGKVTFVGTSSMEIRMHCTDDDGKQWMEAYFTFVATDPVTQRPQKIAPLQPESPAEKEAFRVAAQRAQWKKEARRTKHAGNLDPDVEMTARRLLQESGPLLNMPSLANPHNILVGQTALQSIEIAQPQARNMANQIFGGFLMRRAVELAWSTAYAFGGVRPIFYEVDQVQFTVPVHVGDLLNFHARVLYWTTKDQVVDFTGLLEHSDIPLVSVQVEAWIVDPSQATAKLSNEFYFTFALPGTAAAAIRQVLPSNMEEARTMAMRMAADLIQEADDVPTS
jgi:acyl-coenzyme A thioesterase 9